MRYAFFELRICGRSTRPTVLRPGRIAECRVLPNTAGRHSFKAAVTKDQLAREVFATPWIKLDVMGDPDTLYRDVFGLAEAARMLIKRGLRSFRT